MQESDNVKFCEITTSDILIINNKFTLQIDELNKNVNIPIINEDTEEKIISAIYNVFEDVMGKVLNK